ncbi:hypothetical protein SNEBB_004642 [Seison nebaliae]|nr:hypothetical protein SNEBB_004642 [Seison nebaliae]
MLTTGFRIILLFFFWNCFEAKLIWHDSNDLWNELNLGGMGDEHHSKYLLTEMAPPKGVKPFLSDKNNKLFAYTVAQDTQKTLSTKGNFVALALQNMLSLCLVMVLVLAILIGLWKYKSKLMILFRSMNYNSKGHTQESTPFLNWRSNTDDCVVELQQPQNINNFDAQIP